MQSVHLCVKVSIQGNVEVLFRICVLCGLLVGRPNTWYTVGGYLWTFIANRPLSRVIFSILLTHRGAVGNGGTNVGRSSGDWKGCRFYLYS